MRPGKNCTKSVESFQKTLRSFYQSSANQPQPRELTGNARLSESFNQHTSNTAGGLANGELPPVAVLKNPCSRRDGVHAVLEAVQEYAVGNQPVE